MLAGHTSEYRRLLVGPGSLIAAPTRRQPPEIQRHTKQRLADVLAPGCCSRISLFHGLGEICQEFRHINIFKTVS